MTNSSGKILVYRAAFIVNIIFIVYSLVSILILIFMDGGYPESAHACFNMFEQNRFTAILKLDILSVIVIPLYGILFYGIYLSVKTESDVITPAVLFCILAGIIVFMSSVNLQSIINLYDRWASAPDIDTEKFCLAACEAMLADDMWRNTGALFRGFLIESGALYFSIIMLKRGFFKRSTAIVGIVTHSFDLMSLVAGIFLPFVKVVFAAIAGPLYIIWFILLGCDFLNMKKKSP